MPFIRVRHDGAITIPFELRRKYVSYFPHSTSLRLRQDNFELINSKQFCELQSRGGARTNLLQSP